MEHLISLIILFLSLNTFAINSSAAVKISLDPAKTKVEFLAVGRPSALKIKGQGAVANGELTVQEGKTEGEISVNLDDFKTGMSTRDQHMKEKYLEIEKAQNKIAKLKILKIDLPIEYWKSKLDVANAKFSGTLDLHGVQKNVEGVLNLKAAQNNIVSGDSNFNIKLPDYAITIPSFAGITVAEDVSVNIQFEATLADLP
jgi:polyisoprenoid-binding protein YceI